MNSKIKYIGAHALFFALLLPAIQSSQLLMLGIFKPILIVMPVVMGSITGFLVGYHRQKTREYIWSLEKAQKNLEKKVLLQTKSLAEKNIILERLTRTDILTGLGNRLSLEEILKYEENSIEDKHEYFSILMVDVDYFKKYNDYYGHLKGDVVLQKLASVLLEKAKNNNTNAIRFGGEEFCLLIANCDNKCIENEVKQLLEMVKALAIPHCHSDVSEYITVSIGISTTNSKKDFENNTIIKKADEALYRAKNNGRNRYYVY